eukprot:SAG31_NODE_1291_length_8975_cov_26.197274_2_plen_62_part_00
MEDSAGKVPQNQEKVTVLTGQNVRIVVGGAEVLEVPVVGRVRVGLPNLILCYISRHDYSNM